MINAVAGESVHVVFCFARAIEISLAGEFIVTAVAEVDVPVPHPGIGVAILVEDCDEALVPVGTGDFVPGAFFRRIVHRI
jgi:hypothetical protein